MAAGFTRLCALLAVVLVGVSVTHSAALGVEAVSSRSSSSSHGAILRIEASEVQSIPLSSDSGEYNDRDYDDDYDDHDGTGGYNPSSIYYGGGAGNGFGFYPNIIFDDSSDSDDGDEYEYDDDDDSDSDSDIRISISGGRSHDAPRQQHKRFTLARQWHLFPASAGGSYAWFSGDGSFQLELQVPGQVFVHVLKDDPDYHDEKKKSKDGTTLVAKVVVMANDSALLNDISVVEGSQGWSVVSSSTKSLPAMGVHGLVVRVYLNDEIGKHLVSVVSKGAGDVVLAKKVVPTSAIAFAVSSLGNGGVYLRTSSKLSYVSLALQATGSSRVYLHCGSSVSIAKEIAMTVDGIGAIAVKATSFSTTQLTTKVTNGGDICFAATKLQTTMLNASVAQNGTITTSATHGSSFSEFIDIDGEGVIDTGAVSSMRTSVSIRGGPGDVTVGSGFNLEYSAPATSHVRYRGSRPMMVVARDDLAAPGSSSAQLEKQSSSSRKKCRAVAIPSEPEVVSLVDRNAGAASATAVISVSSPSPPHHVIEDLSSPAAIKPRGFTEPQEVLPDKATQTPSSTAPTPAGTAGSVDPRLKETSTPSISPTSLPSALPSLEPATVLPSPAPPAAPPTTAPPLPEPIVVTTVSPPPPSVPTGVPSTTLLPAPTLAPSPSPATTNSTPPATTTTPTTASTQTSGLLAKVVDYALPIGAGFVAFIWLLHLVLQCCDRRSRRNQYQSINAGNHPASAAGDTNEDPPVLI